MVWWIGDNPNSKINLQKEDRELRLLHQACTNEFMLASLAFAESLQKKIDTFITWELGILSSTLQEAGATSSISNVALEE
jgi:hypothetical protein